MCVLLATKIFWSEAQEKMKNTKRKGTLFRKTKIIEDEYEEDKKSLINFTTTMDSKMPVSFLTPFTGKKMVIS